jgi:hypothetical protein
MLKIDKGQPWVMWPDNLVSNFIEHPANKIFDHDGDFNFTMKFELPEPIKEKKTLIAKLPSYFGLDIVPDGCLLIYRYKSAIETFHLFEECTWDVNIIYTLVIEKIGDKLTIKIDDKVSFNLDLIFRLGYDDNSHIIFGAGNFPKNGFNLNYLPVNLHHLSIIKDNELISEHNFETFIYDKSFDLTDNCNFIHKI